MSLAASRPAEERGLSRDGVRMLVATPDGLAHARFTDLPRFLAAGDLLVVNTSATLAAAVDGRCGDGRSGDGRSGDGRSGDGRPVTVHFSAPLDDGVDGVWVVELRQADAGRGRVTDACPGDLVALPERASVTLLYRYPDAGADRLWAASVSVPGASADRHGTGPDVGVDAFLAGHGRPIRYSYVPDPWPLAAYQTVFSRDPGSAEMPSAGRPFTADLAVDLITSGVVIAPITLHAGVASLEAGEPPLPERFGVPEPTARLVNLTRSAGRRVVAVGTTVTRALESAASADGTVLASRGWTDLVLGAGQPARVVSGLITGWHDPEASHLALLEAVAGPALVRAAYAEADKADYLRHEFGDSCLLLPAIS